MTGRERIEQAAILNGWEVKNLARNSAIYLMDKHEDEVYVAYKPDGHVHDARFGVFGVPGRRCPDEVIAYLQQNKETG